MSTEPRVDLRALLQPPPGEPAGKSGQTAFETVIEDVSHSVAEKILQDFATCGPESEAERYQMYRIGDGDKERLIALDFSEVSLLDAQ